VSGNVLFKRQPGLLGFHSRLINGAATNAHIANSGETER
jgi:hypothetical protein